MNDEHQSEFANLQERFYALAGKIENIVSMADIPRAGASASNDEIRVNSAETMSPVKKRRIKLPEAPLPTFDGNYENWLSFKNAFRDMIGSQVDLSEIDKLHYLKAALSGDAGNKAKVFAIEGTSFSQIWELLERSYEVKRILIFRHLSSIINLPAQDKEATSGISKLADDAQQHLASLTAVGVSVSPQMIIHLLETKLPKITLEKWEATLKRDEFSKLDKMYSYIR